MMRRFTACCTLLVVICSGCARTSARSVSVNGFDAGTDSANDSSPGVTRSSITDASVTAADGSPARDASTTAPDASSTGVVGAPHLTNGKYPLGSGPVVGAHNSWCEHLDPDAVYLLAAPWNQDAYVELGQPGNDTQVCGAIADPTSGYLSRDGRYFSRLAGKVAQYVPDNYHWTGTNWEPETIAQNDGSVAVGACMHDSVSAFVVNAETDERYYWCGLDQQVPRFFDKDGVQVTPDDTMLVSVGYGGTKLAILQWTDSSSVMSLLDTLGNSIPIVGIAVRTPLAVRAIPGGYWVVAGAPAADDGGAPSDGLWFVPQTTGVAQLLGVYPDLTTEWMDPSNGQLDASANLYNVVKSVHMPMDGAVVKRPLAPGVLQVVHRNPSNAPGAYQFTDLCVGGPCRPLGTVIALATGAATIKVLGPVP